MPCIEYILVKGSQEERQQAGAGFMCMVMHVAPHQNLSCMEMDMDPLDI
jgi:hypothetical protein